MVASTVKIPKTIYEREIGFSETTTGFLAEWRTKNKHWNPIPTRYYRDLSSTSDWMKQFFFTQSEALLKYG